MTTTPEVLTSTEAARYLRVTPDTIRRLVRQGRLPAARVGDRMRITRAAIDAFLEGAKPSKKGGAK